jgi:thiosulfate/3-mercaptopyruvate sulfurtransferase
LKTMIPNIVGAKWLFDHLDDPNIQVIDGSWHIPGRGRDARQEHVAQRIPGAIHLDIDKVADPAPAPPGRMLPSSARFAEQVGLLGLRPEAHLVVYDTPGMYSAARVWWLFNTFGHERISVMEGGMPAWKQIGGPIESGPAPVQMATAWPVKPARDTTRSWKQVLQNIETRDAQLIDVRPPEMFNGSTAHLYPGVRDGHIPGALNVPRKFFMNPDDTFPEPAEIERGLRAAGIDLDRPIIISCGSGVTACILSLAMELTGRKSTPIYDGSWEEWGMRADLPATMD